MAGDPRRRDGHGAVAGAPVHHRAFHRLIDASAPVPAYDLAVLACPVDAMPAWMERLAALPAAGTITDVGSVKRRPARRREPPG